MIPSTHPHDDKPATMATTDPYDLLIVIDGTASMGQYLKSLNKSVQDIIRISSWWGWVDGMKGLPKMGLGQGLQTQKR